MRLIAMMAWLPALTFAQGTLRYETRHFEKKTRACEVSFEYPEIVSAASPETRSRINAGILRVLLRNSDWPAADSGARSLDMYAGKFLKFCDETHKGPPGFENRELFERKTVKFFRATPPVFSFRCDTEADAGGVYPFGTTFYINFDSQTGAAVSLSNILQPSALKQLTALAERRFWKILKLDPLTENVTIESLHFPSGRFKLNDNFGIGDKALIFHFNTYEIGAGAMGPTEIAIPYTDMRHLLKPGLGL